MIKAIKVEWHSSNFGDWSRPPKPVDTPCDGEMWLEIGDFNGLASDELQEIMDAASYYPADVKNRFHYKLQISGVEKNNEIVSPYVFSTKFSETFKSLIQEQFPDSFESSVNLFLDCKGDVNIQDIVNTVLERLRTDGYSFTTTKLEQEENKFQSDFELQISPEAKAALSVWLADHASDDQKQQAEAQQHAAERLAMREQHRLKQIESMREAEVRHSEKLRELKAQKAAEVPAKDLHELSAKCRAHVDIHVDLLARAKEIALTSPSKLLEDNGSYLLNKVFAVDDKMIEMVIRTANSEGLDWRKCIDTPEGRRAWNLRYWAVLTVAQHCGGCSQMLLNHLKDVETRVSDNKQAPTSEELASLKELAAQTLSELNAIFGESKVESPIVDPTETKVDPKPTSIMGTYEQALVQLEGLLLLDQFKTKETQTINVHLHDLLLQVKQIHENNKTTDERLKQALVATYSLLTGTGDPTMTPEKYQNLAKEIQGSLSKGNQQVAFKVLGGVMLALAAAVLILGIVFLPALVAVGATVAATVTGVAAGVTTAGLSLSSFGLFKAASASQNEDVGLGGKMGMLLKDKVELDAGKHSPAF